MPAVTNQPIPFGRLERERHIEMLFRAFHRGHRLTPDPQETHGNQPHREPPGRESEDCPARGNGCAQLPTQWSEAQDGGRRLGDGLQPDTMAMLESVNQLHIMARPELQGPQCVPRRIFSISTGCSREQLFVTVEESSCLCLQCCGPARSCSLQGYDRHGRQVFHFERPFRVDACCLGGFCLMEMRVYTPPNHLIGTVRQRWSMFTPLLEVCDLEGSSVIRIQGSCCPCRCLANQEFQVVSMIGERIGTIWKKWPGFNDEFNMDHEYFGLEVPLDMGPLTKLLLLAATFLLNYMYFEMT